MQFFKDTSTPEGIARQIIQLSSDVAKNAAKVEKNLNNHSSKKGAVALEKIAEDVSQITVLQEQLSAETVDSFDQELKDQVLQAFSVAQEAMQQSLVGIDVSINIKEMLLDYSKTQLEEMARQSAGYDNKGEYNIDENEIKKTMPPVTKAKKI